MIGQMEDSTANDNIRKAIPQNVLEKWGAVAEEGYQAVPHALFRYQEQLHLSNGELVTLLNILDFWWEANKNPFPGASALAKRMNTNPRSVQRHLKALSDKGFAIRERGTDEKRRFRLDGLVNRLGVLVRENAVNKSKR